MSSNSIRMPLNVMDAHHDGFQRKVIPVLVERGIGILGNEATRLGSLLR
jgi:hypothetical protein